MNITPATAQAAPWYTHRWPWLLMIGPASVLVAGSVATWLALDHPDAMVVDDYYKQGKAINQDLRRDRVAASMGLKLNIRYDAAAGTLSGTIFNLARPDARKLELSLLHSTLPSKDMRLEVRPDAQGHFSVALPMLDVARWQVLVEGEQRDWRLNGVWSWPHEREVEIRAEAP